MVSKRAGQAQIEVDETRVTKLKKLSKDCWRTTWKSEAFKKICGEQKGKDKGISRISERKQAKRALVQMPLLIWTSDVLIFRLRLTPPVLRPWHVDFIHWACSSSRVRVPNELQQDVMTAHSLAIPDDHPLVLELNSLRNAASRYQVSLSCAGGRFGISPDTYSCTDV